LHAGGIRLAEAFVVLLVVPDAIERAAAGPDQPADQRALAGSLATARDRATGRADRRATEPACAAACWLHAFTTCWDGTPERGARVVALGGVADEGEAAGGTAGAWATDDGGTLVLGAVRLATTSPVITAVATTATTPIAVNFHI
jgi:hypothetical protein